MKKEIEIELTFDEKEELIRSMDIGELFLIIKDNEGNHHKGFQELRIKEIILNDYPYLFADMDKLYELDEHLCDEKDCKTVHEAFLTQEIKKLL